MLSNRSRWLIFVFGLGVTAAAAAGSLDTFVADIRSVNGNYIVLDVDDNASSQPTCSGAASKFSWDADTEQGKTMLSLALAAMMASKQVHIEYSDTVCGFNGNRMLVEKFYLLRD